MFVFTAASNYKDKCFTLPPTPTHHPAVPLRKERQKDQRPDAPTRSIKSARRQHTAPRPSTSASVSPVPSQPVLIPAAGGEQPDWYPDGEEERTPGGGTQELVVGHSCKVVRLNSAQMVIPELTQPPPNMVGGCPLNLRHYPRRSFDKDHHELATVVLNLPQGDSIQSK